MGKMSNFSIVISELRDISSSLNEIASWLESTLNSSVPDEPQPAEPEKALTLEEVRAVLASKARSGHTAEIRSLLKKYGADKLSAVDPSNYKALLADAEVLTDAT